jgi:antitoxin HicB
MSKDLSYYLKLPYKLEITPLSEEDGGGFYARYPELGAAAAHGDGVTITEAVRMADEAKGLVLEVMLEHGDPIPEPLEVGGYSGNFAVRGPRSLHRDLVRRAQAEGVSLNQLVVSYLSRELGGVR